MFVLKRVIFDGFGQKIFGYCGLECRAPMFVILTVVSYSSPIIFGKIGEVFFQEISKNAYQFAHNQKYKCGQIEFYCVAWFRQDIADVAVSNEPEE